MRSVKRPVRLASLAAVLAVAAALLVSVTHPAPAAATVGDQPLISYNMQGATSGRDTKWTTTIGGYVQGAEVVALQEAGPTPPPPAPGTQITFIPQQDPNLPQAGLANVVQSSEWQFGFARYNVYFLQTDTDGGDYTGGRNNLALVTQREADQVVALSGAVFDGTRGRATLGVRFGDTWYFTLHALANGANSPNDAEGLLNQINDFVTARNQAGANEQWIALGDFNRTPGQLTVPGGAQIYNSGQPTQQSGNELDYAVASNPAGGVLVGRRAGASSDHYAFVLGQFRAAAEPQERYSSDRAVETMASGGVLDAQDGGTTNFTPVITNHRSHASSQSWILNFYDDNTIQFQGRGSGRCIDVENSDTITSNRPLVLWDCVDQASQRWFPEDVGDSEVELHNTLRPDLCMNVSGAPDTPDGGNMIVYSCEDTANERFLFTPADSTSDLDVSPIDLSRYQPGPTTLENLWAGGVLDANKLGTGNGTQLISWSRNGGLNQGWQPGWLDQQTLQLEGEGSGRCADIHNSTDAVPGRDMVLWDCTGQNSQRWREVQFTNDQVELQNVAYPSLCMEMSAPIQSPQSGRPVVDTCDGSIGEQWLFTSFDPTGTPEHEHPEL